MARYTVGPGGAYRDGRLYSFGETIEMPASETPAFSFLPADKEAEEVIRETVSNFLPPLRPGERGADADFIRRQEENRARSNWAGYIKGVVSTGHSGAGVSVDNISEEQLEELLYRKRLVKDAKARIEAEAMAKMEAQRELAAEAAAARAKDAEKNKENEKSTPTPAGTRAADKDINKK